MIKYVPKHSLLLVAFMATVCTLVASQGKAAAATTIATPVAAACYPGGSSLEISWTSNDLFAQRSYVSYSDGSTTPSYQQPSNIAGGNSTSGRKSLPWVLPQITGNNYSVYVATLTGLNTISSSARTASFGIDASGPTVPTVTNLSVTSRAVTLTWLNVGDDGCMSLSGYRVLRNNQQIGSSQTASYTDANLAPGTTYTYTIQAYDGFSSSLSAPITVTTPPLPVSQPAAGPTTPPIPVAPSDLVSDLSAVTNQHAIDNGLSPALNAISAQGTEAQKVDSQRASTSLGKYANTSVLVIASLALIVVMALGFSTVGLPVESFEKALRRKPAKKVVAARAAQHYHTRTATKPRPGHHSPHHKK